MTLNSCKKNTKLIDVNPKDISCIEKFLGNCNKSLKTFRYFSSRDISESLKNHKSTVILTYEDEPIGYAHLDRDSECLWLGVCVADNYVGRGFGGLLIKEILLRNKPEEKITLTVDRDNNSAINLYRKHGFVPIETTEKIIKMELAK